MNTIHKTLKCGLQLAVTKFDSALPLQISLRVPEDSGLELSAFIVKDKTELVLFILPDNFPIIRELLNHFDPPKPWYQIW